MGVNCTAAGAAAPAAAACLSSPLLLVPASTSSIHEAGFMRRGQRGVPGMDSRYLTRSLLRGPMGPENTCQPPR